MKSLWLEFKAMNKKQKMMVLFPLAVVLVILVLWLTGCANPNKGLIELELKNVYKLDDYARRIKADTAWDEYTKKVHLDWLDLWKRRLELQLETVKAEDEGDTK